MPGFFPTAFRQRDIAGRIGRHQFRARRGRRIRAARFKVTRKVVPLTRHRWTATSFQALRVGVRHEHLVVLDAIEVAAFDQLDFAELVAEERNG